METFSQNASGRRCSAFTLIELLVSMSVLTLLILLITQLVNSAASVTIGSNKHMDADGQARALFDRMAADFALMVKRGDVDYFIKQPAVSNIGQLDNLQTGGNDQIAFFSEVPGYSSGSPSPASLVAYRVNPKFLQVERFGKGLLWNGDGAASGSNYLVFSSIPQTIKNTWPSATDSSTTDNDNYEKIGPQVFRFEYYYLLKNGKYSTTPYDGPLTGGTSTWVNGLRDVAAISVTIAIIDSKSRVLVTNVDQSPTDQFTALVAAMKDFDNTLLKPGDLEYQWQNAISTSAIPRLAASSIRVYRRLFYLATTPQ